MRALKLIQHAVCTTVCVTNLLYGACTPHVAKVNQSVWKLADEILSVKGANKVIYQSDIPYAITTPGEYAIGEMLTSTWSPVITVAAPNVTIDFKGMAIVSSPTGVLVQNEQIVIRDGIIDQAETAISIENTSNVVIDTMYIFSPVSRGINVLGSSDIAIVNSYITTGNIALDTATNVSVDTCVANTFFITDCSSISVTNTMSGVYFLTRVTNSIFDNIYLDGGVSLTFYTITDSSYNIFSDAIRSNANGLIDLNGTSSFNTFENFINNSIIVPVRIASTVNKTRIKSSIFQNVNPSAFSTAIINNGTNTEVYNSSFDGYVFLTSGTALTTGLVITTTNIDNNNANYWQNLFN